MLDGCGWVMLANINTWKHWMFIPKYYDKWKVLAHSHIWHLDLQLSVSTVVRLIRNHASIGGLELPMHQYLLIVTDIPIDCWLKPSLYGSQTTDRKACFLGWKTVVVYVSVFLRFVCVYGHESKIRYGSLFGFPDDLCVWNGVDHLQYLYLANGTDVDPSAWPIPYIITMPGLYQYEFHYVDHIKSWIWKT